jgi:hypothetical protein
MSVMIQGNASRETIRGRLLELSPRAFEYFAGDLLVFLGLQHVTVTKASGDGGIDAIGEHILEDGLIRVVSGVQVKRHRHTVGRPEIDRLIGSLTGRFQHGIFITTANFSLQARTRASETPLRVDPVSGEQVADLMLRHRLGVADDGQRVDEPYFAALEARGSRTPPPTTPTSAPVDDLISLTALSYALRVDRGTLHDWLTRGRVNADQEDRAGERSVYWFRRSRIEALQRQFDRTPPSDAAGWRTAFLTFVRTAPLTRSYKPVMLRVLMRLADAQGHVALDALALGFREFYEQRRRAGQRVELDGLLTREPTRISHAAVRTLLIRYPLDRFVINGFLTIDPTDDTVRIAPAIWHTLRHVDMLAITEWCEQQIDAYFRRLG